MIFWVHREFFWSKIFAVSKNMKEERGNLFIWILIHKVAQKNVQIPKQTEKELLSSSVPPYEKRFLTIQLNVILPLLLEKEFKKVFIISNVKSIELFHKKKCVIIKLFQQVWRYQFIRFQPVVAFAQCLFQAFSMHHGKGTGSLVRVI